MGDTRHYDERRMSVAQALREGDLFFACEGSVHIALKRLTHDLESERWRDGA